LNIIATLKSELEVTQQGYSN